MRDICLNLDRLDGILIEIVVEEREPGIADVRYSGIGVAVKLGGGGKLSEKLFEHFDRDAVGPAATDNYVLARSYDLC
jgi:hypothetical protein